MKYPALWAGTAETPSRWRTFDQLDRMLDGTFYDHLMYDFYTEVRMVGDDETIPLLERRPSSQYNLPNMLSRWSARKLWSGRHVPRIGHSDRGITKIVDQLIQTTNFYQMMHDATIMGSVGSVAITFNVDTSQEDPQVGFKVWRAKYCTPEFDDFRNLVSLRVNYNVLGSSLMAKKVMRDARGEPIVPTQEYWFIRDYLPDREDTHVPPGIDDYNPVMGYHKYTPPAPVSVPHSLGFVPGVWIRNLGGSISLDGVGTWEKAKNISIEIDYLLSQAARGTRYNCAPELVVVGEFAGGSQSVSQRSPASYIHLRAGSKQEDGVAFGDGRAELLEMTGNGIKAAHELIDKLRNMALEQIGGTRKDPEKLKGVMSGSAMQFMDEDSHDLVMDLRNPYGGAALELMRKVYRAISGPGDPKGLRIDWPRLYQPTAEDLAHLIPGLVLAVTPVQEPLDPDTVSKFNEESGGTDDDDGESSGDGGGEQVHEAETRTNKSASGASTTVKKETKTGPAASGGGKPALAPTGGKNLGSLLTMDEGSRYLKMFMDIDLLPDADKTGVTDSDEPTDTQEDPERRPERPEDDHQRASEPNPMDGGMSA